jgi:transposase InsO family protein
MFFNYRLLSLFLETASYTKRDWKALKVNDVWVGDGHGFKAKVRHPIHGQPFQPEVTFIMEAKCRRILGWSVALSESTIAVADAFRHAQLTSRAKPCVYYSDNGAGQTSKQIDARVTGFFARQNIDHRTGRPGNPQGRGLLERVWPVVLIPLARTYPTCVSKSADENYVTRMLKKLNRKDEGGIKAPTWAQFRDDVDAAIRAYNSEHRENPELEGMTPDEAYAAWFDPEAIVFEPGAPELASLWMPEEIRAPRRGVVELFGNQYFRRDLVERLKEDERVIVRFDIHNAEKVWLFRLDGSYIGDADWDGHKKSPFAQSYMEKKREERRAGKEARGQRIIDEARDEARPLIEMEAGGARIINLGAHRVDLDRLPEIRESGGGDWESEPCTLSPNPSPARGEGRLRHPALRSLPLPSPLAGEGLGERGQGFPESRGDGAGFASAATPTPTPVKTYAAWLLLDARIRAGEAVSEDESYWHSSFPRSVKFGIERDKWEAAAREAADARNLKEASS